MIAIEYKNKISIIIEKVNSNHFGIYFSLLLHFSILLFAIGLPDFFKPKPVTLPKIIPIEIVNVSEITSIPQKDVKNNNEKLEKKVIKQKKFNASENSEIKKIEIQEKQKITKKEAPKILEKKVVKIEEKILPIKNQNEINKLKNVEKFETLPTSKIKPKLKPKPKQIINQKNNTDIDSILQPQPKREPDFSIASMLKDLRNETSNIIKSEDLESSKKEISSSEINKEKNQSNTLSISEIDLLRQQLSSCWNAPAGAKIERGMVVVISAKVQKNRSVIENSVRIVDTNIPKSNTFYGPITESAMRTFFKPECTPLKLPVDKYNLWKNLTITFDYSIMKGY